MSSQSDSDVLSAVQRSDLSWLEAHACHNEVDWQKCIHSKSGDTALHVAAVAGCTQVMGLLLARWFCVDVLHDTVVIGNGRRDIGSYNCWLLSHGCDICLEQQNVDGKRPLHSAVQASHLPLVKILLDHGATIDPLKRADWTPLMLACTKRNLQIIEHLIRNGANIRLVNKDGWTSFHLACREGDEKIINYLLDTDNTLWNTVSKNGRSPLHTAAMHGHELTVRCLLSRGNYTRDESDACGNTAIMESLCMGHMDIARLLISEHQANIYARDKTGRTGFHIAAEAGHLEVVRSLIETYGVDVNFLSTTGMSALHCAAREGQTAMVEMLIKMGCKVNTQDSNGRTALWLASGARKTGCAQKLKDLGAQDIADHNGTPPSHLLPM